MELYLIRHGETDLNKKKVLQGWSDIELNDYGRELAQITAQGLKEVRFDMVFTSPLKRARETAEIVTGGKLCCIEEPRIQEISFGAYEGLCYHKDNYNIPDADFLNFFDKPEDYTTPPQGESLEEVIQRTGDFLAELISKQEYRDKTILISTHGCALKAILANIKKLPLAQFWGQGVHKNCAVTIVKVTDNEMRIVEEGKIFY